MKQSRKPQSNPSLVGNAPSPTRKSPSVKAPSQRESSHHLKPKTPKEEYDF